MRTIIITLAVIACSCDKAAMIVDSQIDATRDQTEVLKEQLSEQKRHNWALEKLLKNK